MTKIAKSHLTTTQASELLGFSEQRVRKLIKKPFDRRKRILHGECIGGVWFVTKVEVERFKRIPNPGAGRPPYSRKRKRRRKKKLAA